MKRIHLVSASLSMLVLGIFFRFIYPTIFETNSHQAALETSTEASKQPSASPLSTASNPETTETTSPDNVDILEKTAPSFSEPDSAQSPETSQVPKKVAKHLASSEIPSNLPSNQNKESTSNASAIKSIMLDSLAIPAGFMSGANRTDLLSITTSNDCVKTNACQTISYTPGGQWGGIIWWNPQCGPKGDAASWANFNEGRCSHNLNERIPQGVKALTFMAKSDQTDGSAVTAEFKVGAIPNAIQSSGLISLEPNWQEHRINLENMDVSDLSGVFTVVFEDANISKQASIIIDDVKFVGN